MVLASIVLFELGIRKRGQTSGQQPFAETD